MVARRRVLAGLLATGLAPRATWADVGQPMYVTAALRPDGVHTLCGLARDGAMTFEVPLPARGHAARAHPTLPHVVAFARRPGTFAFVIDCVTGLQIARIDAPAERHFYGHGVFSADGSRLYTTENDYDAARGVIGIWDMVAGYQRVAEVPSGGVGPHDILRLPGTDTLVVANGGIETHPDTGRAKLNLPMMRPNLSYLDVEGRVVDRFEPADHMNSLRHLAVTPEGTVAFAMQWQGDPVDAPPLLGLHRMGAEAVVLAADASLHRQLQGYAGSVAFSGNNRAVGITSPRGGVVQFFVVANGADLGHALAPDACGLSPHSDGGFCFTTGAGEVCQVSAPGVCQPLRRHDRAFDNHLVQII